MTTRPSTSPVPHTGAESASATAVYPPPRIPQPLISPTGQPILGHMRDIQRDFLGFVTRCAREYGDLVRLNFAGQPALLVSHPDLVEVTGSPNLGPNPE